MRAADPAARAPRRIIVLIARIERTVGWLATVLYWIAGFAVAAMMLHVTADILGKTLLRSPIHGTLEITTYYYMPVVALAPLAIVQRDRGHIFVELFSQLFGDRLNDALDAVMSALTAMLFGLICWFSFLEAVQKTARSAYVYVVFFDLQTWPTRWVVPLTAALVVIIAVLQTMTLTARAVSGRLRET